MADRVPPHDLEAEQQLIGGCLVSYAALDDASLRVQPEDFYKPFHRNAWAAMTDLHATGEHVDIETLVTAMTGAGTGTPDAGALLAAMAASAPSRASVAHRVTRLRSLAQLRALADFAREVSERCYTPGSDPDVVMEWAQQQLFDTVTARSVDSTPVSLQAALDEWWADYNAKRSEGPHAFGLRTGLIDLDNKLSGLRGGQLVTIAGRPGSGKSMLTTQIGLHIAEKGVPVLHCSLEMSRKELAQRIIAARSQVGLSTLRDATISDDGMTQVAAAISSVSQARMMLLTQGGQTVATVRAHARRLKARGGLGLVVVDYLQLVHGTTKRENRQVEVAEVSAGLKRLAMDLDVPVIAAAQLNRGVEYREKDRKRPTLADLRESGSIENDSDTVIGIYRERMYDEKASAIAELVILKQRSGPTGSVDVLYDEHKGEFKNISHPWHDQRTGAV